MSQLTPESSLMAYSAKRLAESAAIFAEKATTLAVNSSMRRVEVSAAASLVSPPLDREAIAARVAHFMERSAFRVPVQLNANGPDRRNAQRDLRTRSIQALRAGYRS